MVSSLVKHPWVNEQTGEVHGAPGLLNVRNIFMIFMFPCTYLIISFLPLQFTIHSDLGRVVRAIIREFEKYPSLLWSSDQQSIPVAQHHNSPVGSNLGHQHHRSHHIQQHHPPATNFVQSPIRSNIPELSNLTVEELQQLNDDPDYLNDFVDDMNIVQKYNQELDRLIVDVETIARESIEQESKLEQLRASLTAKLTEFVMHGEKYEVLNQRYQKKSEEFAPQHIKELLQIAVSTADGICETHVEQFLNRTIDVQTFLDRYLQAKKLSALRKAKEERLTHQLNALERATY